MKKKINTNLILTSILCLAPLIVTIFIYDKLPPRLVDHWGLDGQPNGDSPKDMVVIYMPIFMAAMNIFLHFMLRADPKGNNASKTLKALSLWIIPIMGAFVYTISVANALVGTFNPSRYVMVFIGIIFLVIGNYLPKSRQSYTVGIKTPWALDNEENWNKTHKLAGPLWVAAGVITIIGTFLPFGGIVTGVALAAAAIIPMVYSYRLYREASK